LRCTAAHQSGLPSPRSLHEFDLGIDLLIRELEVGCL